MESSLMKAFPPKRWFCKLKGISCLWAYISWLQYTIQCVNVVWISTLQAAHNLSLSISVVITEGVTNLRAIHTGLRWSAPTGIPMNCFRYMITSSTPAASLTVAGTLASSADLNGAGFPYCMMLAITVTPVEVMTGTPFTSSSATSQVVINDPGGL